MTIDCRNCKYWTFDMDMEPYCDHPQAGPIGTEIAMMRSNKPPVHAKQHCGPNAIFFTVRGSRD